MKFFLLLFAPLLSINLFGFDNSFKDDTTVIPLLLTIILILFLISIRFKLRFQKNWKELSQLLSVFDKNVIAVIVNFDGYIVYASQAFLHVSGYKEKELVGSKFLKYIHGDDKEKISDKVIETVIQGRSYMTEFENIKKDGTLYWVEAVFGAEQIGMDIFGYNVIMHDITVKKEFETLSRNLETIVNQRTRELLDKNNEIEYILNTTMEGILIFDNLICVNANQSAADINGFESKDELIGRHVSEFLHDDYKELVRINMLQQKVDAYEILALKKNGVPFPCLVRGTTFFSNDKEFRVTSIIDLTYIKEKESQLLLAQVELKEQAHRDYLTTLYNRRYFAEIAQDYMMLFHREQKEASVMMIDIDLFKNINDTYGHAEGDNVIKTLVEALLYNTRQSDIVARFGGEEFVVLLPNISTKSVIQVADKLRAYVEALDILTSEKEHIKFTISIGVTTIQSDDETIEDSLKRADNALYIAKNSGRNRVIMV